MAVPDFVKGMVKSQEEEKTVPKGVPDFVKGMAPVSIAESAPVTNAPASVIELIHQSRAGQPVTAEALQQVSPVPLSAAELGKTQEGQFQQFVEGLKDFGRGGVQLGLAALEKLDAVRPGTYDAYTALTDARKKRFDEAFKARFGDKIAYDIARLEGNTAPWMLTPGGPATGLGRIAAGSAAGAIAGAAQYQPAGSTDRLSTTAIGAAGGAAISSLLNTAPAIREWFRKQLGLPQVPRDLKTALESPQKIMPEDAAVRKTLTDIYAQAGRQRFIDQGLQLMDRTEVDYKLSQLTGDPATVAMEQLARSTASGERSARAMETKQPIQIYRYWQRTLQNLGAKRGQLENFGQNVVDSFNRVLGSASGGTGLLGARKAQAVRDFAAVDAAIGTRGTIPVDTYLNTLDGLIAENSQVGATPAMMSVARQLQATRKTFGKSTAMNVSALQKNLSEYGDAAQGRGKLFTDKIDNQKDYRVANALFSALRTDLDNAAASNAPGAAELKLARDNYAALTRDITDVRNTALGALFDKRTEPSGVAIEKAFRTMHVHDVKASMKILQQGNPDIAQSAQRWFIQDHLTRASKESAADAFGFIPAKMLDMLSDRQRFKAMFPKAEQRQLVMDGLRSTRRIMLNNFRTGGRTVAKLKEFAGVFGGLTYGGSRVFLARLAAEMMTPSYVAKALVTKEGIAAIQELSKPYNQNRWSAAIATLQSLGQESPQSDTSQPPPESLTPPRS